MSTPDLGRDPARDSPRLPPTTHVHQTPTKTTQKRGKTQVLEAGCGLVPLVGLRTVRYNCHDSCTERHNAQPGDDGMLWWSAPGCVRAQAGGRRAAGDRESQAGCLRRSRVLTAAHPGCRKGSACWARADPLGCTGLFGGVRAQACEVRAHACKVLGGM